MLNPPLLLADEPVASLDPRISREILSLLRTQARERGTTVLCSLHQVDLAREYADRIVALRGGEVMFDGPATAFDDTIAHSLYEAGSAPAGQDARAPVAASPAASVANLQMQEV